MAEAARRKATYADLAALPPHVVGEILFGVLHTFPRPRLRHARAATRLGARLGPPFDEGNGGPGGWIFLDEPELHFGDDVVVPDLAGWRRESLPELPDAAFLTVAPDWVCEVLSPSTRGIDMTDKRAVYQREGVKHLWFVDPQPDALTLEVQRWSETGYIIRATYRGDTMVRAEPFEALEFGLGGLWES